MSLIRVVQLLSARRWAEGARLLEPILEGELPDSQRGPAFGLYGQALLELGRLDEAKESVRQAMRVAKRLDDHAGLKQLRELNGRVYTALAAQQDEQRVRLAEAEDLARPLDELLTEASTDAERAAVHVRKANVLLDDGQDGAPIARAGLVLAQKASAVREQVLCHLCLARAVPTDAELHLRAAHTVADAAEEAQLVAAISKAARAAGVDFGTHRF